MITPVDELDRDLREELTEFRRDLHAHPELGFHETRTAARVAAALRACGLDVTEGSAAPGSSERSAASGPATRSSCAR